MATKRERTISILPQSKGNIIHHKKTKMLLAFLFLLIVLSACTSVKAELPATLIPQAIDTITPAQPSSAFTPTSYPTVALTLTNTPYIPSTREPTITVPVNLPATGTAQAFDVRATQIASFQVTCEDSEQYASLSPSGNWLALSCSDTRDQTLKIVSQDGIQWTLQFKDYLADDYFPDGSTPRGALFPKHWTNDEKYLYFTSYISVDAGGTCFYSGGVGVQGLYRINLQTGAVSATLAALPSSSWYGYETAFSPDGRMLAYALEQPVILDLITGEEIYIEVGDYFVGGLSWSPDSSELAYATCLPTQNGREIEKSTIEIFSLETRVVNTILEVERDFLSIELRGENNLLRISRDDFQTQETSYLFFEWSSDEFTTPTPTSLP